MNNSEYNLMNQLPILECYLPKFNIQPHYHRLIYSIHTQSQIEFRMVFPSQVPISLVIGFVHVKIKIYY